MESILDIQALLAPISAHSPSGDNLRYSTVYDQIKEARRSDDMLAQGEWQREYKTADWQRVIKLCHDALNDRTKDLQISVWFTEALLHVNGFKGLNAGLEFTTELLSTFWETLYPKIEDGDLDYRIGPLVFLNSKVSQALYGVPICDQNHTNGYTYYDWQDSKLVGLDQGLNSEQKKRRQVLINEGKISAEQFNVAVNGSSIIFYEDLLHQLQSCKKNVQMLDQVVDGLFAPDPPGFTELTHTIDACLNLVERIVKDKQKSEVRPQEDMDDAVDQASDVINDNSDNLGPFGSVASNLTARQTILDISDAERWIWKAADDSLSKGQLKAALDQLMAAVCQAPSVRQKNRYLLFVAKLCLKANRPDLSRPIAEKLFGLVESYKLEQWEHPSWIADVMETLYRCLHAIDESKSDRAKELFQKLCTLNITKAAAYRN